jgi:hypothetical protein
MRQKEEGKERDQSQESRQQREGKSMTIPNVFQKIAAVLVPFLAILAVAVSSASATEPWWHLTSGTLPGSLHNVPGADEVQQLTVEPGALFILDVNKVEVGVFLTPPTTAELRTALEGPKAYGPGDVDVTSPTSGLYEITNVGEDADRTVPAIEVPLAFGRVEAKLITAGTPTTAGEIVVTASNLGDAPANGSTDPVSIADKLPVGLKATAIAGVAGIRGNEPGPVECSLESLTCTYRGSLPAYDQIEVEISVEVVAGATTCEQNAATCEKNEASVTGGSAPSAQVSRPVTINEKPVPFGVEDYELTPEEEGGVPATQAGSHPFQLTTTMTLNQTADAQPVALAKDLHFELPPGLIGNPSPFPQCTSKQFLTQLNEPGENECPPQTAVGVAIITIDSEGLLGAPGTALPITVPVFNLEPNVGEPARFGFIPGGVPVFLDTSVRTGGDYGVTVTVENITQTVSFLKSEVTFWGVPGDLRHAAQRGTGCLEASFGDSLHQPCTVPEENFPPPLLSLPTSCPANGAGQPEPLRSSVEADSWKQQGDFDPGNAGEPYQTNEAMPAMVGCNRLPFTPSIKVTPDGTAGSTPTGLTVDEHVPQATSLNGTGLAESDVKGLSVTLPEGVALNPAGADGLQACSEEEIGLMSDAAPACPDASKVATVKIKTPLLPNPLEGAAYLAEQDNNPFGSLVALYLFAEDPVAGIRAKAAGEVLENPVTGQLTAHFEGDPLFEKDPAFAGNPAVDALPEVPFEDVEVHFFGGERGPLGTPAACGAYKTTGTFTPWSGNPTTESSSTVDITSGPHGSPCASPLPFSPTLTSGTTSIQAGGFTPFTMTMSREDGEQNLRAIQLHMPLGLSGTLSSVKLCGEEQADAGTCGPESEIGETIVSVGLGGDPYTVKGGKVYITGPYKGAPFGLSIVNPAVAGPFNLGKVVVRAKLEVNEETAAITVTTDTEGPYKIPTLIDGIPLQIKHVNVNINRPGFTFNATNCSPLAITGSLTSSEGATDTLHVPYQVTNCGVLAFEPKLEAAASGKVSRLDGTSFNVKLGYPAGPYDANIAKVKVELPKGLPSRLPTLQKACLASVFEANPAACPAASVIGHATATTPVLPVPLSGPAYFVSHGGEAFPSLIIVLQG